MKKMKLQCANFSCYVDFIMIDKVRIMGRETKQLISASLYERSAMELRALTANLNSYGSNFCDDYRQVPLQRGENTQYRALYSSLVMGYEKMSHTIVYNKDDVRSYIFVPKEEGKKYEIFYDYLMNNFSLPLLELWAEPIFKKALREGKIQQSIEIVYTKDRKIPMYGQKIRLSEIEGFHSYITQEWLEESVKEMLEYGVIEITSKQQYPLLLTDMNSYFENYGHTIVENLEKEIQPLCEINGAVDSLALVNKRLYPQQAALVNGLNKLFQNANSAIINGGMGVGKTLIGASVVENFFVDKYLRSHKKLTLKDVYENPECINYRVIIMCPGHLVEKWADECRNEIPAAKVTILNEFKQLVELRENGRARKGREIFIIGKDFCKLSYSYKPLPTKMGARRRPEFFCEQCGERGSIDNFRNKKPCSCGSLNWKKIRSTTTDKEVGLICPECDEIIHVTDASAKPEMFSNMTDLNATCGVCGCQLWTPDVKNLDCTSSLSPKEEKWYKVTHFSNLAKKARTTSWVLKGYEKRLYDEKGLNPCEVDITSRKKSRKYAPSSFIKKYLKGYFDIAIFDELHTYKGGNTAQGIAMQSIIKSSNKSIGLTGTIAGGVASHLFYIFYRMFPNLMKKRGFDYSDEMSFVNTYGTIETEYDCSGSTTYGIRNSSSRGKKVSQPRVKPGISPLVFPDFLIARTLFLDLTDMSNHLPLLKENVVSVEMNEEVRSEYQFVVGQLRGRGGLNSLSSSMLQFSLAYPDKPFDYGNIIDPKTGSVAASPRDFSYLYKDDLLPKEEKLVEIILEEQKEGRNIFIYCEYTASERQKVTTRIKSIVEDYCGLEGAVTILESTSPEAVMREQWIRKKASEGTQVFICNPRCVETGLDFCFTYQGQYYNFPTIIFYQLGTNLFTLWQASRRAYRLIQKVDCHTYYMCYAGTNQEAVIKLMADKQMATSALQGKFSMEGLASMANGIDPRVALLNNLLNDGFNEEHTKEVSEKFASLNAVEFQDESIYGDKRTLLLREVVGEVKFKELHETEQVASDMFEDLFTQTDKFAKSVAVVEESLLTVNDWNAELLDFFSGNFNIFNSETALPVGRDIPVVEQPKVKKKLKKFDTGQVSIFDI